MLKKLKCSLTLQAVLLLVILVLAFVIRVLNIGNILNFYYDQGRDALVIWDLIHLHKFFLIGPTTGLAGIFRGPFYYYLIAPFYFIGRGNPIWPSVFLILTSVAAVFLVYLLGTEIRDRATGLIAALLTSFSFNLILASRWLSNSTPMLLLSLILVWGVFKIMDGKKWGWTVIALVSGLSLFNFGSSGELFYLPAIVIFIIWQWKSRPDWRNLVLSIPLFALTFAPLVLFDLKHQHILLHNLLGTFGIGSGSFGFPTITYIKGRTLDYFDIFTNKVFQSRGILENISLSLTGISFLAFLPKFLKDKKVKVLLLFLGSAVFGLYFYQGNGGTLYDYYMTGYYLIFILLFAVILGDISKLKIFGKILIFLFLCLFFVNNIPITLEKTFYTCQGDAFICFSSQEQAINWIYSNAGRRDFNVDEYVPPVIPYSYNYLFIWLGTTKYNKLPVDSQISLLYTLYEVDPPHPERLQAWLDRQKGIGKVIKEQSFGGITVQERERITTK
ncbi:MAG: glycosyltransferase family 39 protein [Candidatus Microgenomates bacterium]|jgi:4-amino-4-deoxy-L-arabinose transferase-like glycosyltransferase